MSELQKFKAERAQLAERLAALDRVIEALEAYERFAGTPITSNVRIRTQRLQTYGPVIPVCAVHNESAAPARGSLMTATIDAVSRALERRGAPVPLAALTKEVLAENVPLDGKDQRNVLAARLSNSGRFRSIKGFGWWFIDRSVPGDLTASFNGIGPHDSGAASGPIAGEEYQSSSNSQPTRHG